MSARKICHTPAAMLKADLADADISYVVNGLYFDFHALRHQTGTLLAASGVHPKVAQSIMRHGDINLTLSRYSHTLTGQEAKAVEAMPDLSLPSSEKQIATGTDDKCVAVAKNGLAKLTPKLTPQLTPTAYSECDYSAAVGNILSEKTEKALSHNSLQGSMLGTKTEALSANVTTDKAIHPEVLKPAGNGSNILTYVLPVHYS